jgi:hypothetical protein
MALVRQRCPRRGPPRRRRRGRSRTRRWPAVAVGCQESAAGPAAAPGAAAARGAGPRTAGVAARSRHPLTSSTTSATGHDQDERRLEVELSRGTLPPCCGSTGGSSGSRSAPGAVRAVPRTGPAAGCGERDRSARPGQIRIRGLRHPLCTDDAPLLVGCRATSACVNGRAPQSAGVGRSDCPAATWRRGCHVTRTRHMTRRAAASSVALVAAAM